MKNALLTLTVLIAASFIPSALAHAAAVTLSVPAQYPTIQAAINIAANDPLNSYTILIEPGTYSGGITITGHPNSLTITGRETARTQITAGGAGRLLHLSGNSAGSVIIRNLLFRSASEGAVIAGNSSTIVVTNNIFSLDTSGAGVIVQTSPLARIVNNTFYQNGTAVSRDDIAIEITNNIFSGNTTAIAGQTSAGGITNNLFDPATQVLGTNYQPDGVSFTASDPLFVNSGQRDHHLRSGSPAIDTGDTSVGVDSVNSTTPDIGAYGGPSADTVPFPVSGLASNATSTTPYNITVSWQANAAYTVAGYRVHYGTASGVYSGTDAAEGPSPIDVIGSTTTSTVLSALTPTSATPSAPVLAVPQPRDQGLVLSWTAVPGATSYQVHWGTLSTSENAVDVGNRTSYTLSGLTNLQTYLVAVSATSQATYYVAVTAFDATGQTTGVPGVTHESAYSAEQAVRIGPAQQSGLSNEVSGIPEALVAYPDLPNSGCFIATAAYGSYDARPVRVLRVFRDRWLVTNGPGRRFVQWYYHVSPDLARSLNDHPRWRPVIRAALWPIVLVAAVLIHAPWALVLVPLALWSLIRISRPWRRTA